MSQVSQTTTFADKYADEFRSREAQLRASGGSGQKALDAIHLDIVTSEDFKNVRAPGSGDICTDGPFVLDGMKYYTQQDELHMFQDGSLLYINFNSGFVIEVYKTIVEAKQNEYLSEHPYC